MTRALYAVGIHMEAAQVPQQEAAAAGIPSNVSQNLFAPLSKCKHCSQAAANMLPCRLPQ